jgi:hypothetical protein
MTDKAIFYRKGILVIIDPDTGKEKLVAPILNELQSQIDILKDQIDAEKNDKKPKDRNNSLITQNKKKIRQIESQIEEIKDNAQKIIDLNNQIIMCLDTPKSTLYDAIMSIVSQDTPRDQEYSTVDKTASGRNVTRISRYV